MDNFFIDRTPFSQKKKSKLVDFVNRKFKNFGLQYRLHRLPNPFTEMNTIEVRMNYFHLLDSVIANEIEGDVVELGCFTGQCAMLFQKVIEIHQSQKQLHLYDSFETKFNIKTSVEDHLKDNFRQAGLALPHIHKGYFEATIPEQLPQVISVVHIDCGYGGDPLVHKKIMLHCLNSVYPRMSKGAVGIDGLS